MLSIVLANATMFFSNLQNTHKNCEIESSVVLRLNLSVGEKSANLTNATSILPPALCVEIKFDNLSSLNLHLRWLDEQKSARR